MVILIPVGGPADADRDNLSVPCIPLGFDTGKSATPIIPVYLDDVMTTLTMCRRLDEKGVFVNPIIPPAAGSNAHLLRLSVMASHTALQIDQALELFEASGRELELIGR